MSQYCLLIILVVVFACAFWVLYCNEITLRQRCAVIDQINDFESFVVLRDVSYEKHWRTVCFLRDPAMLYPASLRGAFRKDRAAA